MSECQIAENVGNMHIPYPTCDLKKHITHIKSNLSYHGQKPAQRQERQQGRISWLQMSKTNLKKVKRTSQTICGKAVTYTVTAVSDNASNLNHSKGVFL